VDGGGAVGGWLGGAVVEGGIPQMQTPHSSGGPVVVVWPRRWGLELVSGGLAVVDGCSRWGVDPMLTVVVGVVDVSRCGSCDVSADGVLVVPVVVFTSLYGSTPRTGVGVVPCLFIL